MGPIWVYYFAQNPGFLIISGGFPDFRENWWDPGTLPVYLLLPLGALLPYFHCLGSTMASLSSDFTIGTRSSGTARATGVDREGNKADFKAEGSTLHKPQRRPIGSQLRGKKDL